MGDRPSYLAYLVSEGSPKKAGTFCMSLSLQEEKHYNQIFPAATISSRSYQKGARAKVEGIIAEGMTDLGVSGAGVGVGVERLGLAISSPVRNKQTKKPLNIWFQNLVPDLNI